MPFGTFALISLFYVVVGIRVVRDIWVNRKEAFDLRFTDRDRYLVDQAAFFILVPISVALHELGHATAIWGFGGKVVSFRYYVFAGSVGYREPFTNVQHILVAAAGPFVNVILCALALAVIFFRRPPFRAAINELLFQFAVISGINALVFYPILDYATGMEGDWTQMYDGGVRWLSLLIFGVHAGILVGSFALRKNARFRKRLAVLTGMPTGAERGLFGGLRAPAAQVRQSIDSSGAPATPEEARLRSAVSRVASGWHQPTAASVERRDNATLVSMSWTANDARRIVAVLARPDGYVQLVGAVSSPQGPGNPAPTRRELRRWAELPSEDDLTMALRVAMEEVETWNAPVTVGESMSPRYQA